MLARVINSALATEVSSTSDAANVLLHRAPHLLIFVRVNERADSFVGKDFREEPSSTWPLITCTREHPRGRLPPSASLTALPERTRSCCARNTHPNPPQHLPD
jgi:hypothetical protein